MTTNLSNKNIKVQVVCLAYNQVEFIKDALEGFITQRIDIPYEVLIGDDCSTDGTSEIIAEYAKKYPNIIKHIRRKKNMGGQPNSFDLLTRVDADYLALCEGDDYWTDKYKLQKQVDFLEKNKQLNGCFHKTQILKEPGVVHWKSDFYFPKDENGNQFWPANLTKKTVSMEDVLPGIMATSSVLYRYDKNFKYPNWFKTTVAGDRPMHCFMIKDGTFGYIDEVMSVYRVSPKGVWFNKNDKENVVKELDDWVDMLDNLDNFFGNSFQCIKNYKDETILNAIDQVYFSHDIDNLGLLMHKYENYFFYYMKSLRDISLLSNKEYKFLGIPILKVKQKTLRIAKRKYCLFGFIPILEIDIRIKEVKHGKN